MAPETIVTGTKQQKEERSTKLADSLLVPELDRIARTLDETELSALTKPLKALLEDKSKDASDVAKFIRDKAKELEP